jgi:Domain of unknown function (DUF4114)
MNWNDFKTTKALVTTFIASSAVLSSALNAESTADPYQSTARPYGLSIVSPVMQTGSDAAAATFNSGTLQSALDFVKANLPEGVNNSKSSVAFNIDPSKLTLATDSNVRVYFVYEGAGYHNSLGFNTSGSGATSGNPKLIFPDASSSVGSFSSTATGTRSASDPLLPGDFVNLGTFSAGTKLNFFLVANGASGGSTVFSTDASANPDGINHIATFTGKMFAVAQPNSPYLFIAFEDLTGGGDKDYNDTIFALNVGAATVNALVTTPEPSLGLVLAACLPLGLFLHRRNKAKASKSATIA